MTFDDRNVMARFREKICGADADNAAANYRDLFLSH